MTTRTYVKHVWATVSLYMISESPVFHSFRTSIRCSCQSAGRVLSDYRFKIKNKNNTEFSTTFSLAKQVIRRHNTNSNSKREPKRKQINKLRHQSLLLQLLQKRMVKQCGGTKRLCFSIWMENHPNPECKRI